MWWVLKGRAVAPPGMTCIIGVSTSRKPRSSRKRRRARDQPRPHLEDRPALGVGRQVEVALAVAGLDVGQAVPLLGQRPQRLGEQHQVVDQQRQLAAAGAHQGARGTHQVAEVELLGDRPGGVGELRPAHEELQLGAPVRQVDEDALAVLAHRPHPPRHAQHQRLGRQLLGGALAVPGGDLGRLEVVLEAVRVELDPGGRQGAALVAPVLDLLLELGHLGSPLRCPGTAARRRRRRRAKIAPAPAPEAPGTVPRGGAGRRPLGYHPPR